MRNLSLNFPKILKTLIITNTPIPPSQQSVNTIFTHRKHHVYPSQTPCLQKYFQELHDSRISIALTDEKSQNSKILRQIKAFFVKKSDFYTI